MLFTDTYTQTTVLLNSINFNLQDSITTGTYNIQPVIGVPQIINGMANYLSWILNNPKVCLYAPMASMSPTFSQLSTSMHLVRIESVDNSPENYLMEDSSNNNINLGQDFSALTLIEIGSNNSA